MSSIPHLGKEGETPIHQVYPLQANAMEQAEQKETEDSLWILWGPFGFSVHRRPREATVFGGNAMVTLTYC